MKFTYIALSLVLTAVYAVPVPADSTPSAPADQPWAVGGLVNQAMKSVGEKIVGQQENSATKADKNQIIQNAPVSGLSSGDPDSEVEQEEQIETDSYESDMDAEPAAVQPESQQNTRNPASTDREESANGLEVDTMDEEPAPPKVKPPSHSRLPPKDSHVDPPADEEETNSESTTGTPAPKDSDAPVPVKRRRPSTPEDALQVDSEEPPLIKQKFNSEEDTAPGDAKPTGPDADQDDAEPPKQSQRAKRKASIESPDSEAPRDESPEKTASTKTAKDKEHTKGDDAKSASLIEQVQNLSMDYIQKTSFPTIAKALNIQEGTMTYTILEKLVESLKKAEETASSDSDKSK